MWTEAEEKRDLTFRTVPPITPLHDVCWSYAVRPLLAAATSLWYKCTTGDLSAC